MKNPKLEVSFNLGTCVLNLFSITDTQAEPSEVAQGVTLPSWANENAESKIITVKKMQSLKSNQYQQPFFIFRMSSSSSTLEWKTARKIVENK